MVGRVTTEKCLDDSKSPLSGYLLGGVKLRVQISSLLALVVTSRGQV